MTQYIDKSALVAEIKRMKVDAIQFPFEEYGTVGTCNKLLSFLDTFEVEDVDLEQELDEWIKYGPHTNYPWCTIPDAIRITAEHFFELGLKAQKGE